MPHPQEPMFSFIKRKLGETKGRWPDVAKGSGVPVSTVRKIGQGQVTDPGVNTAQALADYFHRHNPDPVPEADRVAA
jgi:hypothetical protein